MNLPRFATLSALVCLLVPLARALDTVVVFNEIHYHPAGNDGTLEFIELRNQNAVNVDLSGWRVSGGVDFAIPDGTIINGGGYLVIAADPAALDATTGFANALGPLTGAIDNGGERIRLRNNNDRLMDEIEFDDRDPWPVAADGSGATLAKLAPLTISGEPANWRASLEINGTPGAGNFEESGPPPPDGDNIALGKPVIDGSGAWNGQPFNGVNPSGENFTAQNVTDGSVSDVFGQTYWLGHEGILNTYFTLDLEESVEIEEIHLRNTHNTQFDDRGTASFRIEAAGSVNGANQLVNPTQILAGTLSNVAAQDPIDADVFTEANGLSPGTNTRYLKFTAITAQAGNNTGLNEIEIYPVDDGGKKKKPPPVEVIDVPLHINEVSGFGGAAIWSIELLNYGTDTLDVGNFVIAASGGGEFAIPAGTMLDADAFLVYDDADLGFNPLGGERIVLYGPSKGFVLDGIVNPTYPAGRKSDERRGHLYRQFPGASLGGPNSFPANDELVINEIMYHHRPEYGTPDTPATFTSTNFLDYGVIWRYNESGASLPADWAASTHPVGGGWQSGPGALAWDTSAGQPPVPQGTPLTNPFLNAPYVVTYYFETEFTVSAAQLATVEQLQFVHAIDDGAIFYLNGVEVLRFGMQDGPVTAATLAQRSGESSVETATISATPLVEGVNRLSVEVHQTSTGSSDIVMGVRLNAQQVATPFIPGVPFAENDEEWIEVYNRGGNSYDLEGTELRGAVRFTFPSMDLAAGEYIVVAKDAAALLAKYPGINVVGNYSASLSNRGEEIRLVDGFGDPIDRVHYRDDKPWPPNADGYGPSLELRDPDADNSTPGAWAASIEDDDSAWQTYAFRLTASQPAYTPDVNAPTTFSGRNFGFHELRLGLLDDGEMLLDDFSVVEDPDGAARQLIANRSFDTLAGWRALGTHKDTRVFDDGGENVMKLVAVDRMNYLNNLIESNLTDGGALRPVQIDSEYEVSFRAKWLSGSPQFRVELYYNRLAKKIILEQPQLHGTPGATNSTEGNIGPTWRNLRHSPIIPAAGEEISVIIEGVEDPDVVEVVVLRYALNGSSTFATQTMQPSGPGAWIGTIPGQPNGTLIQFYVECDDDTGPPATSFAPAGGADSRAIIRVASSGAGGTKQSFWINLLPADSTAMHADNDILSNYRTGCTLIYNDTEIAYDCGVRLRGSMFSRNNDGSTGLNFKFPADRRFRGLHSTITTRRAGLQEILVKHLINASGGLHDNYNDVLQQFGHIGGQSGRTRLEMARFGGEYTDAIPDPGGTVFKMEGLREFRDTQDGTPNTPKKPFPIGWIGNFDLANQGDAKEAYRHNMRINSNFARDDYDSMIAMCKAFSLSGQTLEDTMPTVIDVDMWMRQFALLSLCGIGDTYSQGNPHNLNFYVRPSDGLVEPMPWDWDFTFNRGINSALWGNKNISNVISRPVNTRLFHGHLHHLINTVYNAGYMADWTAHYAQCTGGNYSSQLTYIQNRGAFVLSQLPANVPFAITTNGGADFTLAAPNAELEGDGWMNVRAISLDGAPALLEVEWTDANRWRVTVPLAPGPNAITLLATDFDGNPAGSDTITITNSTSVEPASDANLVVSELMYHPLGDTDTEFIELRNISDAVVDFTGVVFSNGIDFAFAPGTQLIPGEILLIVANPSAFETEYGLGLPIAGRFANSTRLGNGGERIALVQPGGTAIQDFAYNDALPWPELPDGGGPSLTLVAPTTSPDHSQAVSWRPSSVPGGTPGAADSVAFGGDPNGDGDNDRLDDLLEYFLGTDDADASSGPGAFQIAIDPNGTLSIQLQRNAVADGVSYRIELSTDLELWIPGGSLTAQTSIGDGLLAETWQFPPVGGRRAFIQLVVELR